jgi:hypothetical protein
MLPQCSTSTHLAWLLAIGFAAIFFVVAVIAGNYLSRP